MEVLNKLLSIDLNYIVVGLIVVFYTMEQFLETQFSFDKRGKHLVQSLLFFISFITGNLLWATVIVFSIEWINNNHIGLFYLFTLPVWLKLILSVVLYDFITYWFHRSAHIIPMVWRFHRVHHSDTRMDASTNLRSHPLELYFWFGTSNIVAAAIFGLDLMGLGLYFLVVTPFFFIEHSNLHFPAWLDKSLGLVFTTPNFHKVHHEQDQYYTDSNFADLFILWDHMFGTFKYKTPEEIKLGLKEFDDDKKQTFWYLMKSPFIHIDRIVQEESSVILTKTKG